MLDPVSGEETPWKFRGEDALLDPVSGGFSGKDLLLNAVSPSFRGVVVMLQG